jgi:hypothetical protein
VVVGAALADSDSKQRTDGRFVGDRAGCANAADVFIAEKGGGKGGRGGDAFQGGGKGGKGKSGGRGGRGISADDIIDRIMSFDKNKDGKITKDELPERMQFLIERGDTNKDGALDRDEVKKLAADLARDGFRGFDGFGGRGGFGPGGFGGRGGPGGFGPPPGFGPGPGARADRALNDLKLSDKTKDKAEAIIKAHEESVRKLLDLARGDLLLKMKDVLSEQEYKNFKDALERQPGPPGPRVSARDERPATPPASSKTADLEKKLDQLQKDLETLRRELRR